MLERKRLDLSLREKQQRVAAILDTVQAAFIGMDERGLITDWNPQAQRLFGWSREEALGRVLADTIIPAELRGAHERGLKHFLATGEGPVLHKRIEMSGLHRDGYRFPVELLIVLGGLTDPENKPDPEGTHSIALSVPDVRRAVLADFENNAVQNSPCRALWQASRRPPNPAAGGAASLVDDSIRFRNSRSAATKSLF